MTNNKLTFGKYKNKSVEWLFDNDKQYLEWILNQEFFKKFDYYYSFKNYKPVLPHVKFCFDNDFRFCGWCCKKQIKTKDDKKFRDIKTKSLCKVCYNGDRCYGRETMMNDYSDQYTIKMNSNREIINSKQLKLYQAHLRKQ
tara:strand:- start:3919 stop:4341 length:423 start_codon:yes stop_codon:yes gene_type:complete